MNAALLTVLLHNKNSFDYLLDVMADEQDESIKRDSSLLEAIYQSTQHDPVSYTHLTLPTILLV